MMEEYAHLEWFYYMTMNKNHVSIEEISTSNLHCYCDDLQEEVGYFSAIKVEHEVITDGGDRFDNVQGFLCRDYLEYNIIITIFGMIVPTIIIILNTLLKSASIFLVKWIGYVTKSKEISKIQSAVFILTFWNSAISILIINANFKGTQKA
jgi:hypothetical protein